MLNIEELKLIGVILNAHPKDESVVKLNEKINQEINLIESNKDCLWSFFWDCGRQGDVDGLFKATKEEIKQAIGKRVYFGEILGKHSEVYGTLEEQDISLESDDSSVVINALESGYNPLEYLEEENEDEEEND